MDVVVKSLEINKRFDSPVILEAEGRVGSTCGMRFLGGFYRSAPE